jgi:hypothetical protein
VSDTTASGRRSRRQAQAVDVEETQPVENVAGEISPYELPGPARRTNVRKARRGYYAPKLPGAPSTTRQATVLNTALIGPSTGTQGVANGRDVLSHNLVTHDPVTAYNSVPRLISSPNTVVVGGVGGGKSSFVKTVCVIRPLVIRYRRAVIFDKKNRGGEGEYAELVREWGQGEPIRFTQDGSGSRLNLLDPLIVSQIGDAGTYRLLHAIIRIARDGAQLDVWDEKAARAALSKTLATFDAGRIATLGDILPWLGRVDAGDDDMSPASRDRLHQAGLGIRFTLEGLLDEYGGLLDGETSKGVDLTGKLTSFDISQLPAEGPSSNVIRAIGNQWMLGRLRSDPGWQTTCINEEGWDMVEGPAAHLLKSNQKLSRGLGLNNVFVFHKGTDIPKDSPGQTVISEAQSIYVFRQDRKDDADWAVRTFGFDPSTAEVLQTLQPGHFVFKYGSVPETHVQHVRSDIEVTLTDTDEGMRGDARKVQ